MLVKTVIAATILVAASHTAHAFCGFYVSGADSELNNKATQVVLMRQGSKTILSMKNNYDGPAKDFAMVVPVPVVLQKENVKTLDHEIFKRVNKLTGPRLVEYWEQDPCAQIPAPSSFGTIGLGSGMGRGFGIGAGGGTLASVKVEAKFAVGEYDIVILSATDSGGLDTWLRTNGYKIPQGAAKHLDPYVKKGSKFFVAKVNIKKVKKEEINGKVVTNLSPLRFHYDSQEFSLPVRLGLINSPGVQDLIVHILSPGQRYDVANYKNVTIPTNIEVKGATRERFPEFYAALFDKTLEQNPGAVVTEYAWGAGKCDPCPTSPLKNNDLASLGNDILKVRPSFRRNESFVLTRLHARYSPDSMKDDLVFRKAKPIVGGREISTGPNLEAGARLSYMNNFQGRYIIRNKWTGAVDCEYPAWGVWGPNPKQAKTGSTHASNATVSKTAENTAFAKRGGMQLTSFVQSAPPHTKLTIAPARTTPTKTKESASQAANAPTKPEKQSKKGCQGSTPLAAVVVTFLFAVVMRRRKTA